MIVLLGEFLSQRQIDANEIDPSILALREDGSLSWVWKGQLYGARHGIKEVEYYIHEKWIWYKEPVEFEQ